MGEARRVQTHLVAHQGPRRERRCHQTSHTEKAARLDEIAVAERTRWPAFALYRKGGASYGGAPAEEPAADAAPAAE